MAVAGRSRHHAVHAGMQDRRLGPRPAFSEKSSDVAHCALTPRNSRPAAARATASHDSSKDRPMFGFLTAPVALPLAVALLLGLLPVVLGLVIWSTVTPTSTS